MCALTELTESLKEGQHVFQRRNALFDFPRSCSSCLTAIRNLFALYLVALHCGTTVSTYNIVHWSACYGIIGHSMVPRHQAYREWLKG